MPVFTANIPGILKIGDRIEIGGRIKENAMKYVHDVNTFIVYIFGTFV